MLGISTSIPERFSEIKFSLDYSGRWLYQSCQNIFSPVSLAQWVKLSPFSLQTLDSHHNSVVLPYNCDWKPVWIFELLVWCVLIFWSVCNDACQWALNALKFVEICLWDAMNSVVTSLICWRHVNLQDLRELRLQTDDKEFDGCLGCENFTNALTAVWRMIVDSRPLKFQRSFVELRFSLSWAPSSFLTNY